MACPTLWLFWDSVLANCTGCPLMSAFATGSGATGSEGVKFNTTIASDDSPPGTCQEIYNIPSGPNASYGFALTSFDGVTPSTWTLLAHPALGPAYYALIGFSFNCALGWSGQSFHLPSTGANANATGTLTITFA